MGKPPLNGTFAPSLLRKLAPLLGHGAAHMSHAGRGLGAEDFGLETWAQNYATNATAPGGISLLEEATRQEKDRSFLGWAPPKDIPGAKP